MKSSYADRPGKTMVHVSIFSLLAWFFLDMTGFHVGDRVLVSQAYQEDGVFFLIFILVFMMFIFKNKFGGYVLSIWLSMWFLTQFLSHWRFTLFGPSEEKMEYFSETIKLIPSETIYIPDLYHIVLHLLIIAALFIQITYQLHLRRSARDF